MEPFAAVCLVAALAAPARQAPHDLLELRATSRDGLATAVALSDDGRRAFLGQGNAVRIRQLVYDDAGCGAPGSTALVCWDEALDRVVPVPLELGSALPMTELVFDDAAEQLFVAAGTYGLAVMDASSGHWRFTVYDGYPDPRRPEYAGDRPWCFDVALASHGGRRFVLAAFGAKDASELRVYERHGTRLAHAATIPLPPGTAGALAVDGDLAYVAMGLGGLARVRWLPAGHPSAQRGIAPDDPELAGLSVHPDHVRFRDVAVAAGRAYVAADGLGLLEVDLAAPWGSYGGVTRHAAHYAFRVVAIDDTPPGGPERVVVALGTTPFPVAVRDGAPVSASGRFGFDETIGGVPFASYPEGREAWLLFERDASDAACGLVRDAWLTASGLGGGYQRWHGFAFRRHAPDTFHVVDARMRIQGVRRATERPRARAVPDRELENHWTPVPDLPGASAAELVDEGVCGADDALSQLVDQGSPSTPQAQSCELGLERLANPGVDFGHVLRWRARRSGSGQATAGRLELWARARLVASIELADAAGWRTYEHPLSADEVAAIGPDGYDDLRVRFVGASERSGAFAYRVTAIELEVPQPRFEALRPGEPYLHEEGRDLVPFNNVMDGVLALGDPRLVLWGIEAGGLAYGHSRVRRDDVVGRVVLEPIEGMVCPPGQRDKYAMSHFPKGQWREPGSGREWLLGGGPGSPDHPGGGRWRAVRFDPDDPVAEWCRYGIVPEVDEWVTGCGGGALDYLFRHGSSYMHGVFAPEVDAALFLRARVAHGLVVVPRADVEALRQCGGVPGCCDCSSACDECDQAFELEQRQLLTHPELEGLCPAVPLSFESEAWEAAKTWGVTTFRLAGAGRTLAAVAAGYGVSSERSESFEHALLVLHDLSSPPPATGSVAPLRVVVDERAGSSYIAVDSVEIAGRTYVLLADFGGRVVAYDVTALCTGGTACDEPLPRSELALPRNVIDGLPDNPFDLEIDADDPVAGPFRAYVSCYRLGVVELELEPGASPQEGLQMRVLSIVDTPGHAIGLTVRRADLDGDGVAERLMVVGDDLQGGLRLYGDWK